MCNAGIWPLPAIGYIQHCVCCGGREAVVQLAALKSLEGMEVPGSQWLPQGEKLSTNVVLMVTLILAAFALGINIPADLVQLAVELPNSR
jgi:hypothetical protein